jgi:osmoprotectant transport system permease protein
MSVFTQVLQWFGDAAHWSGPDGIWLRLAEHLWYSALATAVAVVIGLPLGLFIGHTNRAAVLAINLANFGRALPTVGLVTLVFLISGLSLWPVFIALVALAVPAIVTNTYAGMRAVDPDLRDAARGVGMRPRQVLLKVEIPMAVPLILTGIRLAAVQVIATATIAAYVSFGGFGRYLFDGLAQRDLAQVFAGAVLVAVLAIAVDFFCSFLTRILTPRGIALQQRAAHSR